jgi:hypothetical protein
MNRQNLIQNLVARKLQAANRPKIFCVCIAAAKTRALCFAAPGKALCFAAAQPKR